MPCQHKSNNKNNKSKSKKQKIISSFIFKINDLASYINLDKSISQVKIIGIHYDTPPDTYYTIEFEDGRTKQTIAERLYIL
jgi:hypothetical protein